MKAPRWPVETDENAHPQCPFADHHGRRCLYDAGHDECHLVSYEPTHTMRAWVAGHGEVIASAFFVRGGDPRQPYGVVVEDLEVIDAHSGVEVRPNAAAAGELETALVRDWLDAH